MKKNRLFISLLMALMIILPSNVKAFVVNPAGLHCSTDPEPANGVPNGICFTGFSRPLTFITQQGDTSVNYFCLSEHSELGPHEYGNTPVATYTNTGFACAVHNLLRSGDIQLSDLSNGYFSFGTVVPDNTVDYTVASVSGSALVYAKLQTEMWRIGENATCELYTEQVATPSINVVAGEPTLTSGSGEYYYSKITVTKANVPSYAITLQGQPTGTIISSSASASDAITSPTSLNEFYVLIPAASLTAETNIRVKTTYNYNVGSVDATMYKYTPTTYTANQNLGRLNLVINSEQRSVESQTQIALNPSIDFKVCKKDSKTNQPMAGIEFKITAQDNSTTFNLTTGTDGCAVKENVALTTYTISELNTPNGYVKLGNKTVNCSTTPAGQECVANIKNTPITLKVKKIDESGVELKDAKMQILDKDGNIFDEWTTVLEDHVVNKTIAPGKYTLREEEAPSGYVIATEIEFTIAEDKYYIGTTEYSYDEDAIVTVEMVDAPTKVSITKLIAETNEPLEGATLRVEDADGNTIDEWVSTREAHVIKNLPYGTYYLVEIAAPEGYVLSTEKVEFVISKTSSDEKVSIHNVPDTIANKSALLISFAMFDIALGIGILVYVNKRKETE